jgi:hypothetical protein
MPAMARDAMISSSRPYPAIFPALALALALGLGPPAAAQQSLNQLTAEQNALWAQQQAAEQRVIALRNELQALEARIQTETRLQQLRDQGQSRGPAPVYVAPPARAAQLSTVFPSIPDKALADSRARILAASANRR